MADRASGRRVYIGCYTDPDRDGRGEGIYRFRMDDASGRLTLDGITRDVANPSFLAIHPSGRFLYSVNGGDASGVSAFAVEQGTGELAFLNRRSSEGANPAYIDVDHSGEFALIANYTGGTLAAYPIGQDGQLGEASDVVRHSGPPGPNSARQDMPHPHMIKCDPADDVVLANDLGLDRTYIYRLDRAAGKLVPADPPFAAATPGAGPRHLAFHPNGRYVYVINELGSTMTLFAYDRAAATLDRIQELSTLPTGATGDNSTAQVVVHPSGRFVYGSNRGHDSIATYTIDQATGRMAPIGHESTCGNHPRNFNVDPSGTFLYVANQFSDSVVVFRIDRDSGLPMPTGDAIAVGSPSCVLFAS